VKAKGWTFLVSLFKTAKADGEIDFDEERILRSVDLNVMKLLEFVRQSWEDNRLDEDEKKQIIFLIKKIEDDAVSLAEYDDLLTKQEEAMLIIIREMISEFMEDY